MSSIFALLILLCFYFVIHQLFCLSFPSAYVCEALSVFLIYKSWLCYPRFYSLSFNNECLWDAGFIRECGLFNFANITEAGNQYLLNRSLVWCYTKYFTSFLVCKMQKLLLCSSVGPPLRMEHLVLGEGLVTAARAPMAFSFDSHFTHEETEVQQSKESCSRSPREQCRQDSTPGSVHSLSAYLPLLCPSWG